ncbi:kita-kyushu lung cancer antigen 1 [Oryctolagus cuniculus]|nr:kita-kyushu lung cancer antigen 1 [Oryctolagus cuniculus]
MIFLILAFAIFVFLFLVWKKRFKGKKNTGKRSKKSASLALIRTATGSTKHNINKHLSVNKLSQEILNNFPHSIAMQKQILVNLRIVEYKLAELEHFLHTRGINGALANQKSPKKLTRWSDSGGSQ